MRRFFLRGSLFLLLPLLTVELLVRVSTLGPLAGVDDLHDVYRETGTTLATTDTTNHIFVGTSRVASAIRPDAFAEALRTSSGSDSDKDSDKDLVAARFARGFSTLAVHQQGLSSLHNAQPGVLDGAVVYVEAPAGIVEPQTWTMRWTRSEWPELLSPYLSLRDAVQFWRDAGEPAATKIHVTAASPLYVVRFWSSIRRKMEEVGNRLLSPPSPPSSSDVDLNAAAGIRTDSAGVALVRDKIVPEMRGWTHVETSRPPIDWNESSFASLVRYVRAHGGDVVVYEMPLSTPAQAVVDSSATLRRDRHSLRDWLRREEVRYVTPAFDYADADFPDLSHLRASRAAEFSRRLADAVTQPKRNR